MTKLRKDYDEVQKAFTLHWHEGSGIITVSGVNAKFNGGALLGKIEASAGWDGTLELQTEDREGKVFTASIGPKEWSLSVRLGEKAPDFSNLQDIFKKGDEAIRAVLSDPGKISWSDASKIKRQFSSQMDDVKSAVETAMKTSSVRPGVTWGISAKGDGPAVAPQDRKGVQVQALLTVVF